MINADQPPMDILNQCLDSSYTRLPVYKDDPENIIGVIHAKDLARTVYRIMSNPETATRNFDSFDIRDVAMEPYFVPNTTPLDDQMRQFLLRHAHFALIVDEYGSLQGLLTLEDILEEIVGEIVDETDKDMSEEITILNDHQADVLGTVHIGRLNETLGIELPEDDQFDTLSGLIMQQLNEIPRSGRELVLGKVQFNIQEANRRQIKSVRITRLEDDTD